MKFTKMQGAGDDFALIEAGDGQVDWSRLALDMCDRNILDIKFMINCSVSF